MKLKNKIYIITVIVLIAVVYFAVTYMQTDDSSGLVIRVHDESGDPMVGASVEVQRGDETFIVLTDSEGNALFEETEWGQYSVTINGVTQGAILYSQTGVTFSYYVEE